MNKDVQPAGWANVALIQVADFNPGVDKSLFSPGDELPFVPMPAVEAKTGRIDTSERRPFSKVKSGFSAFAPGDVLFAKITPCMENGKMAIVPPLPHGVGFGTTEFHVLRSNGAIDPKLLYYFVSSSAVRHEAQHHMTGAVGQKRVPKRYLETKKIGLPPLAEQQRIVEKIETLFAELDKGEEALREVQKLIARYRQSVLKAAVTGDLTADWRESAKTVWEEASELLVEIASRREKQWSGRGNFKRPVLPAEESECELPVGWSYASFDQLFEVGTDGGKKLPQKKYLQEGRFPVIDQGEKPVGGYSDDEELVYAGPLPVIIFGDHTRRFKLVRGRFVCGADGVKLIIPPPELPIEYADILFRAASFDDRGYSRHFQFVKKLNFPVAPRREAIEIVRRVKEAHANADRMESYLETEIKRSAALRKSILKDAFSGKLVHQDPSDEPADELLARIRAERAAATKPAAKKARA